MGETTRERPILFSAPMVLAILAGRKTQTRRLMKPQPQPAQKTGRELWAWRGGVYTVEDPNTLLLRRCPLGGHGDRLWVREKFSIVEGDDGGSRWAQYAADGKFQRLRWDADRTQGWRPSIHMPRWASRITLEVLSVKVERLQDISEEDAGAEGAERRSFDGLSGWGNGPCTVAEYTYRHDFRHLWDRLNGKKPGASWEANPWVWAVSFRRVTP